VGIARSGPTELRGGPILLERDADLAMLDESLAAGRAGAGRVVLVEGPAGIGKSRLLDAARARASAAGMDVLRARAGELEVDYPFGVARQLFEPVIARATDEAEVDGLFAGAAGMARRVVSPEPTAWTGTWSASGEDGFPVLHGLYWLTLNLAERAPLAFVVDDLHWSDPASLRFLAYLARRVDDMPATVILGVRTGEAVSDRLALDALSADPDVYRLRPVPFSEAAVTAVLTATYGQPPEPEFAAACHRATAGNPLFLNELAGALVAAAVPPTVASAEVVPEVGAEAVSRFVRRRLGRLAEPARALATSVAVLGQGELAEAAALADLSRPVAADAAGLLVQAELLSPGMPFTFVHPMVRDAVLATLTPSEREHAHIRAAGVMSAAGAPAERVAVHLLRAPPDAVPGCAEILHDAAARATTEGAAEESIAFLQRALAEPLDRAARGRLLFEVGQVQLRVHPRSAVDVLRESIELADDDEIRGRRIQLLARALYAGGSPDEAVELLQRTLAVEHSLPADLRDHLEADLCAAFVESGQHDRVSERLEGLRADRTTGSGLGGRMLLEARAEYAARRHLARAEAVELAKASIEDDLLLEDETSDAFASAASVLLVADEYDVALAAYDRAIARAAALGSFQPYAWAAFGRARILLCTGALVDAEAEAATTLAVAEEHELPSIVPWLRAVIADVMIERSRLDDAEATLRALEPVERDNAVSSYLVVRARLRLLQARADEAWADIEVLRRRAEAPGNETPGLPWRATGAEALLALGRPVEARSLAQEGVEVARRWGAPRPLGRALRAAGTLGDDVERLREAVDVLGSSTALLERAYALAALGSWERRAGRRAQAREPLRQALDLAHQCGATTLESRVREELLVAGARPRRTVLRGVDALTAGELRVARLAASGQSNREIAQSLFVAPKTVETHLAQVFRKLDVRSRTDIAPALERASV
jgi:DNA-binding CsgD family transcriptional regulator